MIFYLADHLGSIVQETDASSAIVLNRVYDPWGDLLEGSSTAGYAFTGREWDSEMKLGYYRARYYDPPNGRFVSDDPIGLGGGLNFSRYVTNLPLIFVDPFGFRTDSVTRSLMESMRRGNSAEIRNILEAAKDVIAPKLRDQALNRIKDLGKKANDLIPARLKSSESFSSELAEKTFEELLRDPGPKAQKMCKLIKEAGRLMQKIP